MRNSASYAEHVGPSGSRIAAAGVELRDRVLSDFTGAHDRRDRPGVPQPPPVPVFRDGRFSGFVARCETPQGITCNDQGDAELQHRLAEAVSAQGWLDPDHVGIAVENRVVRLSGRGDSPHAVQALRRLAASAPCVAAIIDDLWVDCE